MAQSRHAVATGAGETFELWAVVVAGGTGRRFGRPKQLEPLAGERIIDRSVRAMTHRTVGVVAVGGAELGSAEELGVTGRVIGGETRAASVRAGLAALPSSATHVLVHDAARPLATTVVVDRVIDALLEGAEAVVPVVPITDSLRIRPDTAGGPGTAVDRDGLVAVQTPQGFVVDLLRRVHASGAEASDDATLIEHSGVPVVQVDGDPRNLKITLPHDLQVAELLLNAETSPGSGPPLAAYRVGQGFDVHPFGDDPVRPLVLAGVEFAGTPGLVGHSDADVIAHACTDAILGAAGLGDIGTFFPDTDPGLAGADSIGLLSEAARRVQAAGWQVVNIDCTVILDRPKIAGHRQRMQEILSGAVNGPVSIKGKRTEGVSGLGGGIQCHALALLQRGSSQ